LSDERRAADRNRVYPPRLVADPNTLPPKGSDDPGLADASAHRGDCRKLFQQRAAEHWRADGAGPDHLNDVDCDCDEAIAAARLLLPSTIRFGRTTSREAHWLYNAEFPATAKAVIAFDDPIIIRTNAKAARLIELRSGADGKGCQTVFPGSVHESGEPINWEPGSGGPIPPTVIDDEILTKKIARVAAAALLARYWPPKGNRHDLSLALGGALARSGWDVATIEPFVDAVVRIANDPRPADRVRCACDAAEAVTGGKRAFGFPKLKQILGPDITGKLAEWLNLVTGGGRRLAKGVALEDFHAYMPLHSYIYTPTREPWPAASVNARIPPIPLFEPNGTPKLDSEGEQLTQKAAAWLDENRPVEQMTWCPGLLMVIADRLAADGGWIERDGVSCFNLYRPPAIDCSSSTQGRADAAEVQPWLSHVHRLYEKDTAFHIIDWLAHRVQRPQEKINHAVVLGGWQGIGKDTMLEPVKHAVGPWNFQEAAPQQLTGRFNGFVKSVILRVSEARDLGDVNRFTFYDHMKIYTAAPPDVLRVDEKNLREHAVFNCCGVIITSNYKNDSIYLPADDRRHFVTWSNLTKEEFTKEYWDDLWNWYANGGIAAIAAYLASLDISSFNPKAPPPKTEAFWAIVDANRAPEDAELADVIEALGNPNAFTLKQITEQASAMPATTMGFDENTTQARNSFEAWIKDRKNRRQIPHRMEQCGYVPVRNTAAKDGLWVISGSRQVVYAKIELSLHNQIKAAQQL
jgi:hypothetical protein